MSAPQLELGDIDRVRIGKAGRRNDALVPWFVVQLKPNGFASARQNLLRQGYESFMPMCEVIIRHARSKRLSLRPLFPGYLFVGFDPEITRWRSINSTFGVSRLICARTNHPQAAPESFMTDLFAKCDENDIFLPDEALCKGDAVRVINGPFAGLTAQVDMLKDQERIALLLDVMGRATRAQFGRADLEKIPAA